MNIQDFEVTAVSVDRPAAQVEIQLRAPIGTRHVLTLSGVKAFRVEDLVMQNEVGEALFGTKRRLDDATVSRWITWATSLSDSRSWLYDDKRVEWVNSCLAGNLELVVLIPAAGAQIAAVCERAAFDGHGH